VTGFFQGPAIFGEGEPNETTLTATGTDPDTFLSPPDIFVAKYDGDGMLLWATKAGGVGADEGLDIATTQGGDSYVTGFFRGTATFGEGEPNETTLTSTGERNIFVAKYDRDGALVWATRAGGAGILYQGSGIATTELGDSYVTGIFTETATFGEGEPNETTLTSVSDFVSLGDIFVAKYDRDGALLWATQAGGALTDASRGIATTASGESYVTGRFRGIATFGEGEPNETTLTSPGPTDTDIFVAKYR